VLRLDARGVVLAGIKLGIREHSFSVLGVVRTRLSEKKVKVHRATSGRSLPEHDPIFAKICCVGSRSEGRTSDYPRGERDDDTRRIFWCCRVRCADWRLKTKVAKSKMAPRIGSSGCKTCLTQQSQFKRNELPLGGDAGGSDCSSIASLASWWCSLITTKHVMRRLPRLLSHLNNDVQLDRVPSRKASEATHNAARVVVLCEMSCSNRRRPQRLSANHEHDQTKRPNGKQLPFGISNTLVSIGDKSPTHVVYCAGQGCGCQDDSRKWRLRPRCIALKSVGGIHK
jgi:hypothetical protein